jgi:hypothetical protein
MYAERMNHYPAPQQIPPPPPPPAPPKMPQQGLIPIPVFGQLLASVERRKTPRTR